MEFSDDNEFWTYAEKTYSITSIDEISAGNKNREIILIDGIVLGSEDENAITKKYTIGFRSEDGSYKCYSETFQPSWNNLMTDISIMDTLKQEISSVYVLLRQMEIILTSTLCTD